jgi:hypothetical protein
MNRDKAIHINIIGGMYMITSINYRTLKRICALENIHLIDPHIRGYNYLAIDPCTLEHFITTFVQKGYEVIFL